MSAYRRVRRQHSLDYCFSCGIVEAILSANSWKPFATSSQDGAKVNAVDPFGGVGGASLGVKLAGHKVVGAVDNVDFVVGCPPCQEFTVQEEQDS